MPFDLTTNFVVPNPLCGAFTTVFSQDSGPGSSDLAALIQSSYSVPTTSISPTEPTFTEGSYTIRVTLTLENYPTAIVTQSFTLNLLSPCDIANLSLTSQPFNFPAVF